MREEEVDAPGVQQLHKGPRRKTAPTSEGGDIQQGDQEEPTQGDRMVG
jgi:hypothetical protein